jgi:Ring finger domain
MRLIQRRRREKLRRRVASGEVDLEGLGIKRLTIPPGVIEIMPRFIFVSQDKSKGKTPASPHSTSHDSPRGGMPMSPTSPTPRTSLNHNHASPSTPSNHYNEPSSPSTQYIVTSTSHPQPTATDAEISELAHRHLPFAQSSCPICLEDFLPSRTVLRELPCSHVFHPSCVDPFLLESSSLCPLCKKSALPLGSVPTEITNGMVKRERRMRRLRERGVVHVDPADAEGGSGADHMREWGARYIQRMRHQTPQLRSQRRAASTPSAQQEMQLHPLSRRVNTTTLLPEDPTPVLPRDTRSRVARARERAWNSTGFGRIHLPLDEEEEEETRPGWGRTVTRWFPGF